MKLTPAQLWNRRKKIYATKKRLIESAGKEAGERYRDGIRICNAMTHLVNALCECALANHIYGGSYGGKSSDGMEWTLRLEQIGRRNPKTGRIDKRFKRQDPL